MTESISRRSFVRSAAAAGTLLSLTSPLQAVLQKDQPPASPTTTIPGGPPSARTPKSLSVLESMTLAGHHLLTALNPEENFLSYFNMKIGRDYKATYVFTWPAHNIGRWLDALLRLENATGFSIPPQLEAAMVENLRRFYDNPDDMLIPPTKYAQLIEPPNQLEIHSMREGLLALTALVRFRDNQWALEQAHRMLETVWRISNEDGTWSYGKLEAASRMIPPPRMDTTQSHGRFIEALVWFYEASQDLLALRLANRFAKYHLANTTFADGTLNLASKADHTHSYLGTLRGLVQFGRLTNQQEYIERVAATYRTTVLGKHVQRSGAIGHGLNEQNNAEPASTGDAVQLGLWLAENGYPEFLDDAERMIRACLLPSQIVQQPELIPAVDDHSDEHANLSRRAVGAFGGVHPPFWGKYPVTDITCAVLHSLVDVYRHIAVSTPAGLTVNFHFDYENEKVRIRSVRRETAQVTIEPKTRENVLVRIPSWAPVESTRITVNGHPCQPIALGKFACIPRDLLPGKIELVYNLPVQKEVERLAGVDYTLKWKGDDVMGIAPNSDFFPFYPTQID